MSKAATFADNDTSRRKEGKDVSKSDYFASKSFMTAAPLWPQSSGIWDSACGDESKRPLRSIET